jgi:hypothetical protein
MRVFGKRSEMRDAHDRYPNVEVAYPLQRMETYPGAVILATNCATTWTRLPNAASTS